MRGLILRRSEGTIGEMAALLTATVRLRWTKGGSASMRRLSWRPIIYRPRSAVGNSSPSSPE